MLLNASPAAMEGLERLRAKFTIDLHPSRLASPTEGVRAHLSSLLLRCVAERVAGRIRQWHVRLMFVAVFVAAGSARRRAGAARAANLAMHSCTCRSARAGPDLQALLTHLTSGGPCLLLPDPQV